MGAPWFKLYSRQLLSDSKVRLLSHAQLGMLVTLWAYHNEDGSIPSDPAVVGKLLGASAKEIARDLPQVLEFFVQGAPGQLISQRMLDEQVSYDQKCQKLRASASIGGSKKAANTVANAKANATGGVYQNPTEVRREKEKKKKNESPYGDSCAELPSAPSTPEPSAISFPCVGKDGQELPITEAQATEWQGLFPGVDVHQQLRSMRAWLVANPTKRKTARGIPTFVVGWLSREQNRGQPAGQATTKPQRRTHLADEAITSQIQELNFLELHHVS